jgi:hypothetical protein
MTEISQRVQKALNYIETKEPSKTELINFFNQVNKDEKITDHEREILIESVEKQMRIKFPKSAKKILGGKSAKAQELLEEIFDLLTKEFDWSKNCVGNKVKVSGRMIAGKEYVGWYISYKNDDGYSTGFGYRQITVEEDPYLEIDHRRVGKKYENEREAKTFPVELKDEAINLYKNFLAKTIK